jgi:hypothetical protein
VLHWQASESRQPFKCPSVHRDKSVYASEPMAPGHYSSQAKAQASLMSARRSGSYQDLTRIGSERASERDRGRVRDIQRGRQEEGGASPSRLASALLHSMYTLPVYTACFTAA